MYLGEADADSKRVFEHLSKVCSRNIGIVYVADGDTSIRDPALVKAARAILQRPWFNRIWVLQEVFHGMGNVEVVCGPDSAWWDAFASCCLNLCALGVDGFESYSGRVPYVLEIGSNDTTTSLYDLLCQTRYAEATDDRDQFFAILSMVDDDDDVGTLANYGQSTLMVYTAVGLYLLRHVKLLLLLSVRHPHSRHPALASWIPDWSYTDDNDPFWISNPIPLIDGPEIYGLRFPMLECCRCNKAESDHFYHPVLLVTGYRVSQITSLGATFDFETSSSASFEAIKRIWDSKGLASDTPYIPPGFTLDCKSCDRGTSAICTDSRQVLTKSNLAIFAVVVTVMQNKASSSSLLGGLCVIVDFSLTRITI